MKHIGLFTLLAILIAMPTLAQQAPGDPLTAALKRQWDGVALNLKESAEKMPADKDSFKPSPDVKSFAGEVGHGANTHYFFCSRIKGEPNPNKEDFEKATSKDQLVKALIASSSIVQRCSTRPMTSGCSRPSVRAHRRSRVARCWRRTSLTRTKPTAPWCLICA